MTTTDKLPPLPDAANENRQHGRAGFSAPYGPAYTADQMHAYALAAVAQAEAEAEAKPAPDYRGYANLGTGQYVLNHSAAGEPPEVIISIATEEEKAGRAIGEERENPPGHMLQPDAMAVRLRFTNPAGLAALENEIRKMRETHGWAAAPAPAAPAPLNQEWLYDAVRDAGLDWHKGWDDEVNRYMLLVQAAERAHGIGVAAPAAPARELELADSEWLADRDIAPLSMSDCRALEFASDNEIQCAVDGYMLGARRGYEAAPAPVPEADFGNIAKERESRQQAQRQLERAQEQLRVAKDNTKDAERYRWLWGGQHTRQGVTVQGLGLRRISKDQLRSVMEFSFWCSKEELDAAIDAAIAASKKGSTK